MSGNSTSASNPEEWLDRYGDVLFRYARSRVGSRELAEELVQETLIAALRARHQFSGRSSEQTWMIGILRRKIVDHVRRSHRESTPQEPDAMENLMADAFDRRGRWKHRLPDWPTDAPDTLQQHEFWDVLNDCVSTLPAAPRATFCLHELEQLGTQEVCKVLSTSASNVWTQLHRARMLLRRCLELNWFTRKE